MTARESVLSYIRTHSSINGDPLTTKQIKFADELRLIPLASLYKALTNLAKDGYIRRTHNLRGIVLIK